MHTGRLRYQLRWIPYAVANALKAHGIADPTRYAFMRHLGWPKSTTYQVFDDDAFNGIAPDWALAEISDRLRIPIGLLAEPVPHDKTMVRRIGRRSL